MRECLAATGSSAAWMGAVALVLVAAGVWLVARRRRDLARGGAMGVIALVAVLALGLTVTGGPSARAVTTDDCPPTTQSAPAAVVTPAPTPAPTAAPTPTPEPTPTPTPTPTPVVLTLSGTYTVDGVGTPVITDPPGAYVGPPTPAAGATWSQPTLPPVVGPAAGVTVTLSQGGAPIATTVTDAAGQYSFDLPGPGDYTVSVGLPIPSYAGTYGTWTWNQAVGENCSYTATVQPWSQPAPLSATAVDTNLTGLDFSSTNPSPQINECSVIE